MPGRIQVLKSSITGIDVGDADPDQKALDTDIQTLVEHVFANAQGDTTDGEVTIQVTNPLGYLTAHVGWARDPFNTTRWYPMNGPIYPQIPAGNYLGFDADLVNVSMNLDVNNLNIYYWHTSETEKTVLVHYILYINQADNAVGTGKNNIIGNIKAAKDGVNLDEALDARQVKYMSGKNIPKIDPDLSGSVSLYAPEYDFDFGSGFAKVAVNHNLGYVPRVNARCFFPDNYEEGDEIIAAGDILPYQNFSIHEGTFVVTYYVTTTQVVFLVENPAFFGQNVDISYHILRDKIA